MATVNLGRVRGTMWYSGTGITGTPTSGTIYPNSGVAAAYVGDMYLNLDNVNTTYTGNVYTCVTKGNAATAEWVYSGAIKVSVDIVNSLSSTDTAKALSANQGRVLKELVDNINTYPFSVLPKISSVAAVASVTVRNENGTITIITDNGEEGTYAVTASGSGTTKTVTFAIGSEIGLTTVGAVVQEIQSTTPITDYTLYDENNNVLVTGNPNLWTRINEAEENVRAGSSITDGNETVKSGILSKIVDGVRAVLWPITHAKAVWYDKTNNKTVHDVIGTDTMGTSADTLTGAIAEHESDISALNSNKVNKTGDTMTGTLKVSINGNTTKMQTQSSNMTAGSTQSATKYGNNLLMQDSSGSTIGQVYVYQNTNGQMNLNLGVINRLSVNGSWNSANQLQLRQALDGTNSIWVTAPAAWRSALSVEHVDAAETAATNRYTRYMKFENGSLICMVEVVWTGKVTTEYGSMFFNDSTINGGNWPVAFAAVPFMSMTCIRGSMALAGPGSSASKTSVGQLFIYRPVAATTNNTYYIDIIAYGRWK